MKQPVETEICFQAKKDQLHWSDTESSRVEETFVVIKSNHHLVIITATPKPHPPAPHPDTSSTPPGMAAHPSSDDFFN